MLGEASGSGQPRPGRCGAAELFGEACRGQIPTLTVGGLGWPSQCGEPWDAGERGWDLASAVES